MTELSAAELQTLPVGAVLIVACGEGRFDALGVHAPGLFVSNRRSGRIHGPHELARTRHRVAYLPGVGTIPKSAS